MTRPPISPKGGCGLPIYTIIYTSWNKLDELIIFGKLDELDKLGELEDFIELEDFTKLVIFTNTLPNWNNEKTQPCGLGLI